jgi:hypothetical protein
MVTINFQHNKLYVNVKLVNTLNQDQNYKYKNSIIKQRQNHTHHPKLNSEWDWRTKKFLQMNYWKIVT